MNPKITEMTTDQTIPLGDEVSASWVSSDMCAEASKPVSVYCALSRPTRATYSGMPRNRRPKPWLASKPVLLTVVEKTVPTLVVVCWLSRTQTMTISDTPTTCHQTDT